jgi:hypothetical protein
MNAVESKNIVEENSNFRQCLESEIQNGLKDIKLFVARGEAASRENIDLALEELQSMISSVRNGEVATYKSLSSRLAENQ